jgi:hypothetical protein
MLVGLSPLQPTNSKTHKCCCSNRCETNQNIDQPEKNRKETSYLVKQIRGIILLMLFFFCNNIKCRHFPRRRNKQTEEDRRQIQPAEEEVKKQARKRSRKSIRRTTERSTQAKKQTSDLNVGGKKLGLGLGLGFGALGVVPVCLFATLHPFVLSPAIGRRGGETRWELRCVGFVNFRKILS